jgi:fatty-acid desaturase
MNIATSVDTSISKASFAPLYGYYSEEASYLVNDYPYGSMRCQIRFWLERDHKKGFRFVSQTQDPKRLRWNQPRKSTYSKLGGCMYLDEKGHVVWSSVTEYTEAKDVLEFVTRFPMSDLSLLRPYVKLKVFYYRQAAEGKLTWTVNGAKIPPTEADLQRYGKEMVAWAEVASLLNV